MLFSSSVFADAAGVAESVTDVDDDEDEDEDDELDVNDEAL